MRILNHGRRIMVEETKKKEHKKEEKSLEKMTIKELRAIALEIPRAVAVHDMKKAELIACIKEARGIKDDVAIKIKKKVAESNREGQANRFELLDIKPGFIQSPNAYTDAFERAMQHALGHHRHSYVYSFCDSSYFYRAGIPTVLFGPGRMELGHGTNEYVNINQVKDATEVFAHSIENILSS
jgi:acetylornithine deacetylase/succinyl-diaminopimelate desuccinylase-like protein